MERYSLITNIFTLHYVRNRTEQYVINDAFLGLLVHTGTVLYPAHPHMLH